MKSALWRKCVVQYVIPNLPGTWAVRRFTLYQEPVDWLLRALLMDGSRFSTDYGIAVTVQLLAVPFEYNTTHIPWYLSQYGSQTGGRRRWHAPATVAESEADMREILDLIISDALPFFAEAGTIPGYLAALQERNTGVNCHLLEEICYLQLIQNDIEGALRTAETTSQIAPDPDRPWIKEVIDRIRHTTDTARRSPAEALDILRSNVAYTRSKLGLPAPNRSTENQQQAPPRPSAG
jgi:hypothetical protein